MVDWVGGEGLGGNGRVWPEGLGLVGLKLGVWVWMRGVWWFCRVFVERVWD